MLPCWKGSHIAFEEIRDFCGADLVKSAMKTGCGMIWTHWGPSRTTMPIYGLPLRATPIFHNNNFDVVMSIYRWFHGQGMRIVPLSIVFSDKVCRHYSGQRGEIVASFGLWASIRALFSRFGSKVDHFQRNKTKKFKKIL